MKTPVCARVTIRRGGAAPAGGSAPTAGAPVGEAPQASDDDEVVEFKPVDGAQELEPAIADPTPSVEPEEGAVEREIAELLDEDRAVVVEARRGAAEGATPERGAGAGRSCGPAVDGGGGGAAAAMQRANGKSCSWKMTCREVRTRRETGSKHRYPR